MLQGRLQEHLGLSLVTGKPRFKEIQPCTHTIQIRTSTLSKRTRRLLARPFMAVLLCPIPRAESLVSAKARRLRLSCRTDVPSTKM